MKTLLPPPFFVTIPHSGENIPEECAWLSGLDEKILYSDVDRWVDKLYGPALEKLKIPSVKTDWHRYAVDLNRGPGDIDATSVIGSPPRDPKRLPGGFHWTSTIKGDSLMKHPMPKSTHDTLVAKVHAPFHAQIEQLYAQFISAGAAEVFHLDLHSMPSVGTKEHRDPGETRADIVVSDGRGQSAQNFFVDLVLASFSRVDFEVRYNWPYYGGKITEMYGVPSKGRNAIQVELNRSLYMDEVTKQPRPELWPKLQTKLSDALEYLQKNLSQ